jgi:hypothetical protein
MTQLCAILANLMHFQGHLWALGLAQPSFLLSPARTYAEAQARIAALRALDDATVRPGSGTAFRSHGKKTARAVVFYHGYTNAPPQFDRLGEDILSARL